jgi:hypothetical protein
LTPSPEITVVLCTYNRADRLAGAVGAILAQQGADHELVVVDDGSTDDTPTVLATLDHPRLRVVRRPNGGLSKARNTGIAAARGRWIVFIDDDDRAEPGWLASFLTLAARPDVGIACCGATFVDDRDEMVFIHEPHPFGEPFGTAHGSYLAGTFAARTDLVRQAGGYLDGLGTRHQSELFLRLLSVARADGLEIASTDERLVRIEAREPTDRPGVNPRRLYDGTRWILARHAELFAGQRTAITRYEGVAATNAARLGEWRSARRRFLRSALASPTSPRTWGRLALAAVPAAGRRVWNRHGVFASHDISEVGVLDQTAHGGDDRDPELFLAWRYRQGVPTGDGGSSPCTDTGTSPGCGAADDRTGWRVVTPAELARCGRVGRRVARQARRRRWSPLVEVQVPPGGDGVAGEPPGERPGVTLCLDGLERVEDPVALLRHVAEVADGGPVVVATPDRSVVDPDRPVGPPSDTTHRREWTHDQFELLLLSAGFDVEHSWTGGPLGEILRRAGRRRRAQMVFLVRERAARPRAPVATPATGEVGG